MQRQRVDKALIWRLMRFPDEPESESFGTRIGTRRAEFDAINPVGGDPRAAGMPVAERKRWVSG
jgi:hypothetical protein